MSLSLTDSSPSAKPAETAVNVMPIVQLAPGANPAPIGHVVPEMAKLPAGKENGIVGFMAVNATVLELFVSVAIIGALVVFT
ncbi:MAG: hypothetical protein WAN14_08710, partial [Candidatus Acidiferrales bacterium]